MTDNYVLALERDRDTRLAELERCRSEVERFVAELNRSETALEYWKAKTASAEADVDRLTRERDEAERLGRVVTEERDEAREQRDAAAGERDEALREASNANAAVEQWKARAEAAEADNAALMQALRESCSGMRALDWVNAILSQPHPGAALLERMRTQDEDICRMAEEIEAWKGASGLERGGDPDGVRPDDLAREMEHLRAAEKVVEVARSVVANGRGWGSHHQSLLDGLAAYDAAKEGKVTIVTTTPAYQGTFSMEEHECSTCGERGHLGISCPE